VNWSTAGPSLYPLNPVHDYGSLALYRFDIFERLFLPEARCAEWSWSDTVDSLPLSEKNLAHRTNLMHAAVKPKIVSAIMSQGEVLKYSSSK
jgi:hypothetical protein